jgi:MFS family permease
MRKPQNWLPPPPASMKQTFRALAHRNFRLFFAGQSVSLIGTWMQQVAMQWVVFLLARAEDPTNAGRPAFWLGVVGFASQIPAFFLAPVAGVLVDTWNRHRVIVATQTLAMLQAFLLAWLTLTDTVSIPWILGLSVVLGLVNAFDMPARQAFLSEMITNRDDLGNAIALNSSMFNGARLVGPALAAALLAAVGPGLCFLANGVSFLAVLAALLAMRVPPREIRPTHKRLYHGLREGFVYAFGFPPIRALLMLVGLVSMAGLSYAVLLPLVATDTLGGDVTTFGMLTVGGGVGALTGAVFLAARKSILGLGRWIRATPVLLGCALVGLSFCAELWQALPLLAVVGFAAMVHMGSSNTVVQTIVDEDKRGRVMSLYTMAFMGLSPLGSLLAGWVAERYGVDNALRAAGLVCLAGAAVFALRFHRLRALVRPIYVRLGILPELTSSVHPQVAPPLVLAEEDGQEAQNPAVPR